MVHKKICSTSLTNRKMQLKTAMKYYYIPIRSAKIKTRSLNAGKVLEKVKLLMHCCWEYKML